ncbi:hypothetical protein RRG08_067243 [Elysia crispata]|uniref:Uncharacterized protein n=1 Tax=Elysia crispata TaxID=231223 RepID=A0AAE0ZGC4_9GAST|nr:hypothetical protein RRG08_067243 [Elysia crispata]
MKVGKARGPDTNFPNCCQERLKNFSLTVYPVTDSYRPITYRGSDEVKTTYSVVPSPRISFPVTQVKITEGFNRERLVVLCEVFIFGEIACPSNRKYGLRCERECNCVNQISCFVHSGGCPSGCAPGYTGLDCRKVCETGRYGIECTHNCTVNCGGDHNSCNHIDGTCTQGCDPGYTGRLCEDTCSATCGGRTTLVTRPMEPVHRDVTEVTQGGFVSQCVLTGRMV